MEKYCVNSIQDGIAEMQLFGGIGREVNGHFFAAALYEVAKETDNIRILINSEGGSVIQGYSIYAAIRNVQANIETVNVGVCASMAAMILMAGDKATVLPRSRTMVHAPSISGGSATSKEKEYVRQMYGSLQTAMVERSGLDAEKVKEVMDAETWYTAEEAIASGIAMQIGQDQKEINVTALFDKGLKVGEMVRAIAAEYKGNQKPDNEMKEVIAHLKLEDSAEEATIIAKVKEIEANVSDLEAKLQEEKDKVADKVTEIEVLSKKVVESVIDNAITINKLDKNSREEMIEMGLEVGVENLEKMLSGVSVKVVDIKNVIDDKGKTRANWTFEDYQKNDPKALLEMQTASPKKFERLFNAYETE
jgi:ATP-dependent Clp protease protease subunit